MRSRLGAKGDAIPGASRLRNQNEILIEKSDEALIKIKTQISSRIRRFIRREAIRYFTKFALANLIMR